MMNEEGMASGRMEFPASNQIVIFMFIFRRGSQKARTRPAANEGRRGRVQRK
jgi:hypothetical protein